MAWTLISTIQRNEDSFREMSQATLHRAIRWKQSNPRAYQAQRIIMVPDPEKLEIGISLVRMTGCINRFLANVRKHQNDGVRGELTPRELR